MLANDLSLVDEGIDPLGIDTTNERLPPRQTPLNSSACLHERTSMLFSPEQTSRQLGFRVAIALALFASGCGYADYQLRLNESRNYYAYLDKIEQSLAPKWVAPGNLMELRVPKQFILIPPPPPPPKDDEKAEQPIDQRQPAYVNLTLPGLFGAWEATLKVSNNGKSEELKGYIYTLSNYWEFAGEHAADAGEFTSKLKDLLADKLGVPEKDSRTESHPKMPASYRPQLAYEACSFKEKEIDGSKYSFEVYSRTQGSIIGVIVIVLPDGLDQSQKVSGEDSHDAGNLQFHKSSAQNWCG